jgi:hypothetical protein
MTRRRWRRSSYWTREPAQRQKQHCRCSVSHERIVIASVGRNLRMVYNGSPTLHNILGNNAILQNHPITYHYSCSAGRSGFRRLVNTHSWERTRPFSHGVGGYNSPFHRLLHSKKAYLAGPVYLVRLDIHTHTEEDQGDTAGLLEEAFDTCSRIDCVWDHTPEPSKPCFVG